MQPFSSKVLPSKKAVKMGSPVLGSSAPAQSLYDLYQVLSWLASQRSNVEEQLKWQVDMPDLMVALISEDMQFLSRLVRERG